MRKVVASLFISLDGVVEAPDQWQFDHFDQGMMDEMVAQLNAMDAVQLGRVTYEEWAPYWPTATDEPFATFINNTPKYVVSTRLERVDWQNSALIKGDLTEALTRLTQQPGKNIGVAGSPGLVRSLLQMNLLDELLLQIHPVIAGKGKRLFPDQGELKRLRLVDSRTTPSGVLLTTYQPRTSA